MNKHTIDKNNIKRYFVNSLFYKHALIYIFLGPIFQMWLNIKSRLTNSKAKKVEAIKYEHPHVHIFFRVFARSM